MPSLYIGHAGPCHTTMSKSPGRVRGVYEGLAVALPHTARHRYSVTVTLPASNKRTGLGSKLETTGPRLGQVGVGRDGPPAEYLKSSRLSVRDQDRRPSIPIFDR